MVGMSLMETAINTSLLANAPTLDCYYVQMGSTWLTNSRMGTKEFNWVTYILQFNHKGLLGK